MRLYLLLWIALLSVLRLPAQSVYGDQPLAHTFSIVAYDPVTGDMGVAVQSHWFSVGTLVIWGEAGVGTIATQSFANPTFGPEGLALLKKGFSAEAVVNELIQKDEGKQFRQLGIVDANGNAAAFTGDKCIDAAGHLVGNGFAVQANLMDNGHVWSAMAQAFENSKNQPLAERLVAALEAAQRVGGDIRGQQSAALLVVSAQNTGQSWVDRKVDLRVDDHATPIAELKRLLKTHRAYDYMNRGDAAMEHGEEAAAMQLYASANALFPENEEMKFWHAVNLANAGKINEAIPMFTALFDKNIKWATLLKRLPKSGLLKISDADLQRILNVNEEASKR